MTAGCCRASSLGKLARCYSKFTRLVILSGWLHDYCAPEKNAQNSDNPTQTQVQMYGNPFCHILKSKAARHSRPDLT